MDSHLIVRLLFFRLYNMLFLYIVGATCICRWLLPMYICHQWLGQPSRLPDLNPNILEGARKVHLKGKSDPDGIY